MQRPSHGRVSCPTRKHQGNGNEPFGKIGLAKVVEFSSCCRLCVTSHEPDKMIPLFMNPVSSISSKIKKVIRVKVQNGDGLPTSICNSCVAKLNYVHDFIEKSLAADRFLRETLIQARAALDACPPAVLEVEVEGGFKDEPISVKAEPSSIECESFASESEPIVFEDELITSNGELITCKGELIASEGEPIIYPGPEAESNNGEHSYSQPSVLHATLTAPRVLRVAKGQRITVLKIGARRETKRGHINFVDSATGQTNRMPLECRMLSQRELDRARSRLKPKRAANVVRTTSVACETTASTVTPEKPVASKPITGTPEKPVASKPIPGEPVTVESKAPFHRFSCETCGRRFRVPSLLRNHMRYHTGERPFVCGTCGKAYTIRTHLSLHMRLHTGVDLTRYECEICGQRTTSLSGLRQHMSVHTDSRPFACPICGKGFKHKPHVRGHLLTHSTGKPHVCAVCGKRFKVEKSCARHEAAHVRKLPPPERTFQCHVCGKAFGYKVSLEGHVARHEGLTREFECSHCGKRFLDRYAVKRHIVLVHLAERPFPCAVCGRAFKIASYVRKHMFKVHGIDSSSQTQTSHEVMLPG